MTKQTLEEELQKLFKDQHFSVSQQDAISFFMKALLQKVRDGIPEEKQFHNEENLTFGNNMKKIGWNACRAKMLENLKEYE